MRFKTDQLNEARHPVHLYQMLNIALLVKAFLRLKEPPLVLHLTTTAAIVFAARFQAAAAQAREARDGQDVGTKTGFQFFTL